jgi:hypothetical protein
MIVISMITYSIMSVDTLLIHFYLVTQDIYSRVNHDYVYSPSMNTRANIDVRSIASVVRFVLIVEQGQVFIVLSHSSHIKKNCKNISNNIPMIIVVVPMSMRID